MSMQEDSRIVKRYPDIFDPLYDEWEDLDQEKCNCVRCGRCKRIAEIARQIHILVEQKKREEMGQ